MDHSKLLKYQEKLDNLIHHSHSSRMEEYYAKKTIALIVEFSELLNELSDFKYWKKNKKIDMNKVYEEFADVLHFLYSIYLKNFSNENNEINIHILNIESTSRLSLRFYEIASKISPLDGFIKFDDWKECLKILLSIGRHFEMTDSKIEEAYIRKHEINLKRIEDNY